MNAGLRTPTGWSWLHAVHPPHPVYVAGHGASDRDCNFARSRRSTRIHNAQPLLICLRPQRKPGMRSGLGKAVYGVLTHDARIVKAADYSDRTGGDEV